MIDVECLARILAAVQRDYLTDRDQYGGRSLPLAQAEAVLAALPGYGRVQPDTVPLPAPPRRLVLMQVLIETAAGWPRPDGWADLVAAACGYGGYSGHPGPAEAEFAAMAPATLAQLLTPEPAERPRAVFPYCPHPHVSGQPERLTRTPSGWACRGQAVSGAACLYETSPGGQPGHTLERSPA